MKNNIKEEIEIKIDNNIKINNAKNDLIQPKIKIHSNNISNLLFIFIYTSLSSISNIVYIIYILLFFINYILHQFIICLYSNKYSFSKLYILYLIIKISLFLKI